MLYAHPLATSEAKGASTGDKRSGHLAGLIRPSAVAVAADGTLYLAELDGHKIRCVDPKGIITTHAGTGVAGFAGRRRPGQQRSSASMLSTRRKLIWTRAASAHR